jgi:hypothetical protein
MEEMMEVVSCQQEMERVRWEAGREPEEERDFAAECLPGLAGAVPDAGLRGAPVVVGAGGSGWELLPSRDCWACLDGGAGSFRKRLDELEAGKSTE